MSTRGLALSFDPVPSTYFRPPARTAWTVPDRWQSPDGLTMIPWEMGKQLVWDVTVVDALAPSRLNQGSLCNPGTTAAEVEARKIESIAN